MQLTNALALHFIDILVVHAPIRLSFRVYWNFDISSDVNYVQYPKSFFFYKENFVLENLLKVKRKIW